MNRRVVNLVCYIVCMLCLFVGTLLGITLIWVGFDNATAWRGLATTGAVFVACLLVVGLNAAFGAVPMPEDRPRRSRYEQDDESLYRSRSYEP